MTIIELTDLDVDLVLLVSSRSRRHTRRHVSRLRITLPDSWAGGEGDVHGETLERCMLTLSWIADTSILDPIWDITQMATSIICCCAPAFPAVFAGLSLPKPLSSLFSSLSYSKGKFSKGRSGGSTERSRDGTWVPMSASQAHLAWTQISAAQHADVRPSNGSRHDTRSYDMASNNNTDLSYPLKVVEVRQDFQYV